MIPIITIDGPVSSGKGTVARLVAARLAWHLLDSALSTGCWACTPPARAWPWMTSRR